MDTSHSHSDRLLLAPMLYVPADRQDLSTILSGQRELGICSLAVCLEDAVRPENHRSAAVSLRNILDNSSLASLQIFVRPANVEALEWLIEHLPTERVRGYILPKATVETINCWVERSSNCYTIIPILESQAVLDPIGRRELAQACAAHRSIIPCARIGANDIFSLLGGLRRPVGRTVYETPVGFVIDGLIETFSASEVRLCGPVFDRIEDISTLTREVAEDISRGLFSKTAITPRQVQIIWDSYRPTEMEIEEATHILSPDAPAVFGLHGGMLEPACHTEWARRLLWRANLYRGAEIREGSIQQKWTAEYQNTQSAIAS